MAKTALLDRPAPAADHALAERPTGLALLREPFPAHQISKLPKPFKKDAQKGNCKECGGYHGLPAAHLDYVGHAALTDRLLDADPAWTWEPVALTAEGLPRFDATGGLWIRLTVCGVTRIGYGNAESKAYMDAGAREKEVIGDALRNAGMRFGAALDLWHKGQLHADDEDTASDTGSSPAPTAAVVDVTTGEEVEAAPDALPTPPAGYFYVADYKFDDPWHEAALLRYDAQGGSLKVSTKWANIGVVLKEAQAEGIPVKVGKLQSKANRRGEAYVGEVEKWTGTKAVPNLSLASSEPAVMVPEDDIPF